MQLAGEAGALLRIEEEIQSAIEMAREQWLAGPKPEQEELFPETVNPKQGEMCFDFTGVTRDSFWTQAEEKIFESLREYANEVQESEGLARRRLFAEDAAQGFAFIDLCRHRFDVTLMNPPFGTPPDVVKSTLKSAYKNFSGNLLCAFVTRSLHLLENSGLIGCITDATWLQKTSYESFRREILSDDYAFSILVDLGWGVLDGAQVATCMQTIQKDGKGDAALLALDLRTSDLLSEKQSDLSAEVVGFSKGLFGRSSISHRAAFSAFPDSAIAYWCLPNIKTLFEKFKSIDPAIGSARVGLQAGDTARAFRLAWEPSPRSERWQWIQNGGEYSPYYRDSHLKCWSENDFAALRPLSGARLQNLGFSNRPGLTWGKRTDFLAPSILPAGQLFSNEGHSLFIDEESDRWLLLAVLNSKIYQYIINT